MIQSSFPLSESSEADPALDARPLEDLHVPKEAARRALAERFEAVCGFPLGAAQALARGVVDPAAVRRALEYPLTQPIPDGDVQYIIAEMWTAAVSVNPNNPRQNERVPYPAAIRDLSAAPAARLSVDSAKDGTPMLVFRGEDPQHVAGKIEDAAQFVRNFNPDLGAEIATERVLEPITAVMAEFRHQDGSAPAYAPVAIDGSTRTAHCQELISSRASDAVYKHPRSGPRDWNGFLSQRVQAQDLPTTEVSEQEAAAHRALRYHARIIIGVKPVRTRETLTIADAVRAIVAGIHVSPPKEWPGGSTVDEIADAVLDRLEEDGRITAVTRRYLAGLISPMDLEGERAYADTRALHIARVVFDPANARAVSAAHRIARNKQKLGPNDNPEIVAELLMRGFRSDFGQMDVRAMRSILQRTINMSEFRKLPRKGADRTPDELLGAALEEHEAAPGELGPARLELGLRAAYWLVQQRALRRDTPNSKDNRAGSAVLRALLLDRRGLYQLHRAIIDGRAAAGPVKEPTIRRVDHTGTALPERAGGGHMSVDDAYLRETWPVANGTDAEDRQDARGPDPAVLTDRQRLEQMVGQVRTRVEGLHALLDQIEQVQQNGISIAQTEGIPWGTAEALAAILGKDATRLQLWALVNKNASPRARENDELRAEDLLSAEDA